MHTSTASASRYNTVHFIRALMFALELHSDQSEADWKLLSAMGTGVRESNIPVNTRGGATYLMASKTFVVSFVC